MLIVEKNCVGVYNYQGRLIASPKWPNMRLDCLRVTHISISPDILAVRDIGDTKSKYKTQIQLNLKEYPYINGLFR